MANFTYSVVDNFETDVRIFPISGDYEIVTEAKKSGTRSLSNVKIGDSKSTDFFIELDLLSNTRLSFWYFCSSEGDYDRFTFYVDGIVQINTGNMRDWVKFTYELGAGKHTLRFNYKKDGSRSYGYDRFFIDELALTYFEVDRPFLMFSDEYGIPYNNPAGEIIANLDFGNLTAGQVTPAKKLKLTNFCGFDVTNVRVLVKPIEFPAKVELEVSQYPSPFIPEENNIFNGILRDGESVSFYARLVTHEDTVAGGDFYIYAKADLA